MAPRDIKKIAGKKKVDKKQKEKIINEAAAEKGKKEKEKKNNKMTTNISIDRDIWFTGKKIAMDKFKTTNFSKLIEILIEKEASLDD